MTSIEPRVIESTLEESGRAWKRREPGWVIAATASCPLEVCIVPDGDSVLVEAALASWDAIGEAERAALTRFLGEAARSIAGVRGTVREKCAVLTAAVPSGEIEAGLGVALVSVAAAARLAREAEALLTPEVAEAYLSFVGAETHDSAPRR